MQSVEPDLDPRVKLFGAQRYRFVWSRAGIDSDTAIDRRAKNQTAVVISMIAQQLNSTGRIRGDVHQ